MQLQDKTQKTAVVWTMGYFLENSALAEVSSENSLSDISSLSLAVIETVIINLEFISSVFVYVILEVGYNN